MGCRERRPKRELIRVVRTAADGKVVLDPTGKLAGRGAYVCSDSIACLEKAVKSRALERALEAVIEPEVYESLRSQLEKYGREKD
jgi:predicted RNA-binding protein YlxR (DUF448 family)